MVKIHGKSWRVSWQKLDVLVGAVLWYVIPVKRKPTNWKATYLLCCSHGLLVEENSSFEYSGDNIGPSNVIKEHLKRVKTTGHSKKGKKEIFVPPICWIKKFVFNLYITNFNVTKWYTFYLYNLILYKWTKGIAPKKKKAEIKKEKALEHKHRIKRIDVQRWVSKQAMTPGFTCSMRIWIFLTTWENKWYLHRDSSLQHSFHPKLDLHIVIIIVFIVAIIDNMLFVTLLPKDVIIVVIVVILTNVDDMLLATLLPYDVLIKMSLSSSK